ncbi:PREDICTED: golgin subfamily A member 3-like [Dufourea novaeangliae]|uniref:golgin subfamily A member 3-like n=1 Tax=Dufourea novaeangliae TaxID=178035 RepID=UPI000767B06C|nr:PREDICTED: golgin subfamily A member 3-like [Dufourea novaeangliae]
MSSTVIKGAATVQRNKTPTNPTNRYGFHREPASNTVDEASSGSKSQNNSVRRSPTKPSISPTGFKRPSSSMAAGSAMKLENQYMLKKKRFQQLRKDLLDKQKVAQDIYNEMSQLREKVIACGAKDPGKLDELRIEVGVTKHVTTPLEPVTQTEPVIKFEEKLVIGRKFLENLEKQLQEMPQKSQNFCREIARKQTEFVAFVNSRLKTNTEECDGDNANAEMTTQLEAHEKENEILQTCLEEMQSAEVKTIAEIMKTAQDMIEEFENDRVKLLESKNVEGQKELQSQLEAVKEELKLERERSHQSKERMRQADSQLQKARVKIRELEAHVENGDGKIQLLQGNLKSLETQMKQKDMAMELKLKDMQKTMKSSENLVNKVEKQRDSFETRLMEIREKMSLKENETMSTIKELSEKLNVMSCTISAERQKRQQAEEAFNELEERYKQLEEKSNQLCELAEKNKDFTIIEGNHTENDVRLFNELQETRAELEVQKRMIAQLQTEKEEIVTVMHQAASHDEDEDSREKLAVELVTKTTQLKELIMQNSELKRFAKNAQEKNGTLEKQLKEIQARLQSQTKEGGKAGLNAYAIDLQQQVSDLRHNVAELMQQNVDLENALTQKQLELEQRDRVMREQSKFLKVRDELLDILKGKVEQQNGELSNSDENNEYIEQIAAKTEAIQKLFTTLKEKQMQIMRLEKMVKLMEDQQDRAQAQRTRLENRIAQLELALQRNKEQRGKGFSIL